MISKFTTQQEQHAPIEHLNSVHEKVTREKDTVNNLHT